MARHMKLACLALSSAIALGGPSMSAHACEETLSIAYQTGGEGRLHILVNEATIHPNLVSSEGNWVAPDLLLPGENLLEIELTGPEGAASARLEVFSGCEVAFPAAPGANANSLLIVEIDTPGRVSETFSYDDVPDYIYVNSEPTDKAGLDAAIDHLRELAQAGDVDGFLAYQEPLLHDARLSHPERAGMLNHMAMVLLAGGEFEVVEPEEWTIKPVLGGRAYQVMDASGQGPLQFIGKDGSQSAGQTLAQARIWIKTAEGWRVLRN